MRNNKKHPLYCLSKGELKKLSKEAGLLLQEDIVIKALEKGKIDIKDVLNSSIYSVKALNYPSIRKCLLKKMNSWNIFYSNFCIKKIFELHTEKQLIKFLKDAQKMIKRSPFSIFLVPSDLHDEIHHMKQRLA